jgi:hypothetical protein
MKHNNTNIGISMFFFLALLTPWLVSLCIYSNDLQARGQIMMLLLYATVGCFFLYFISLYLFHNRPSIRNMVDFVYFYYSLFLLVVFFAAFFILFLQFFIPLVL